MQDVLHRNEIPISIELAHNLVAEQFPQFADMPIAPLGATGSTNRLFRLGGQLLIRLPRQPDSGAGIRKEARWLPELRSALPLEIPEIVALGQPSTEFPEPWSITRWLEGDLPKIWPPGDPDDRGGAALAAQLAGFIKALQDIEVTEDARADESLRWYRGRPLAEYDQTFRRTLEHCRSLGAIDLDFAAAERVWSDALQLSATTPAATEHWYHSDLVAENLLLREGNLAAVLDFGGLAIGDPTIDLHGAWELFDPAGRMTFRSALGVDDEQWLRGRAWALAIALGALSYYWQTMPNRCRDRLAMARAVLADAARN